MVKHPVGVFLQIVLILAFILSVCVPVQAGITPGSPGESVLHIYTYDWKGTLLREGWGYFSDREGTITTVVPVVEGGYFVEAIGHDGAEYIVERINTLSEGSGLVFTFPEEKPLEFTSADTVAPFPVKGDRISIPAVDGGGYTVLQSADVLEAWSVPGLGNYLYMKTSLPLGGAGNPVFNERGEVAGMVLVPGEDQHNMAVIVSTDRIRSSYGVSGEVVSILAWTEGLTLPWLKRARGLYLKGFASYNAGDYSNAVDYLERAVASQDHGYKMARLILGDCYRDMGETQKAVDCYEKALEKVNKLSGSHLSLARLYLKQNRLDETRRLLEGASSYKQAGNVPVIITAWLLDATGNRSEALAAARKAAQMDPGCPVALGTLGELLSREGRFNEAYLALEQSDLLRSSSNEFAGEFCYAALRSGRYDQAREICGEMARSGREKAQSLMYLGEACAASGLNAEAVEFYRRSVTEDPRNLLAWCRMGDLFARTGLHREAVSTFSDALEVFPDSAWLRFKLGKVCAAMGDLRGAARQFKLLRDTNEMLAQQLSLRMMAGSPVPDP